MKKFLIFASLILLSMNGCAGSQTSPSSATNNAGASLEFRHTTMLDSSNPFAKPSALPYGIADFAHIKSEDYKPAIEAGMAQQLEEIAQIADQTAEPTFENTLVAFEKTGELLNRANNPFSNAAASDLNDVLKATANELAPKMAAHKDAIYLNEKLFKRIETLYNKRDTLNLDAESMRLLEVYYRKFVRAGAKLTPEQKKEISAINAELASLETRFGQNILDEVNDSAVLVDTVEELDGFSQSEIDKAAADAKARGQEGKYLIVLDNTSIQSSLKTLKNRALRERIHKVSLSRGMRGNAFDNRANAIRLIELRAKRAKLLGYDSYAAYALEDQMAANVKNVNDMLYALVAPAKASLEREAAELQALIDAQNGGFKLEAWDWMFYAEQLRKQKYALDDNALKPYFELDNVIQNGVFYAANILYGVTFKERHDIATLNSDARVFEVFDADGKAIGLFIGDYFARDSKLGGAWMTEQITQSKLLGQLPVIENQINIAKPANGEKVLLTYEEVRTIFHEFGHALHGLLSDVNYPRLSGTNVSNDFVEFPSQFNETWAAHPKVLANYAVHYETGEKLPQELLDKVIAAAKFNQGYMTVEYLAATILDQLWHQMTLEEIEAIKDKDFATVETELLEKVGLNIPMTPPRYRSTYFMHIFANGYNAKYYAYIWSEVLDADAEQWFKTNGMSRETGMQFRNKVLSRGNTAESMSLYRDFTGREPSIEPLLIRRGLK